MLYGEWGLYYHAYAFSDLLQGPSGEWVRCWSHWSACGPLTGPVCLLIPVSGTITEPLPTPSLKIVHSMILFGLEPKRYTPIDFTKNVSLWGFKPSPARQQSGSRFPLAVCGHSYLKYVSRERAAKARRDWIFVGALGLPREIPVPLGIWEKNTLSQSILVIVYGTGRCTEEMRMS